jgi:serpin B
VAPASLTIALAMLHNGARGQTESEILAALHASSVTSADLDEGWAGLTAQWSAAAKSAGIRFSSANSLWQQRGLALRTDFMAALARYFSNGVWQVDFADDMSAALSAMNRWTAQHTNGKIAKLFDSLDPTTLLVLANAVYFSATWQSPFDPAESQPAPFVAADGSQSPATFMTSPRPFAAASTSTYQAAELPYAGGRFAALAIMPTQGSVADFVRNMDGSALSRISASLTTPLAVKLPRFTTTSTTDLRPVLGALGIHTALGDSADFSAMSPTPMRVGQAVQRVYLKVGEKGTEAAAATGIGMVPTMAGPPFAGITFDHPFLFLIRDTETGAVLFAAAINRPDAG